MENSDTVRNTRIISQSAHDLTEDQLSQMLALFDATYADADHSYLLSSFEVMGWVALATHNSTLIGFGIADVKLVDLPRMQGLHQVVTYGIACIDENFRRMGLFARLANTAMLASGKLSANSRYLNCGRTAHPVSHKFLANIGAGGIPEPGRPLSPWHLEIVERVAALYCVKVYPGTCVVIGKGVPIGYPRLNVVATDIERKVFENVNRDKGEALLTMSWSPDAPSGW